MLCCIVEAMPRSDIRTKMIEGAVRRLAVNGVEGTSFADVLAATEGAVAVSRALRSREPFDHVAVTLTRLAKM